MTDTQGIIYAATGERFLKEALISAKSVKNLMPEVSITIFTDNIGEKVSYVDNFITFENPSFSYYDKIESILNTPYDRTIFLDTDTYVLNNLTGLFEILDKYDLALTNDVKLYHIKYPKIPDWFPELSTGIVIFNKNRKTNSLFRKWRKEYNEQQNTKNFTLPDQPPLRKVLFEQNFIFFTLSKAYNLYIEAPFKLSASEKAMVLHGRGQNYERTGKIINKSNGVRVFLPGLTYAKTGFDVLTNKGHKITSILKYILKYIFFIVIFFY